VIVIDSSAMIAGLMNDGPARTALASEQLHGPHLLDSEVVSAIRGRVLGGRLDAGTGWQLLNTASRLAIMRYPSYPLLGRIWELRTNLSAYDATYVALAETLSCQLLTADLRIASVRGLQCPLMLVPG
jgi:predicted nucleic acid-binding protein